MVKFYSKRFRLFKVNFDFKKKKAYQYIFENGIIEDSAYPFNSGQNRIEVISNL
jgi:hypothetical protein